MVKKAAASSKPKPKPKARPAPDPEEDDTTLEDDGSGDDGSEDVGEDIEGESLDAEEMGGEDDDGTGEDDGTGDEVTDDTEGEEVGEETGDDSGDETEETTEETGEEVEEEPAPVSAKAAKKPYPLASGDIDPSTYVPLPPETKVPEGLLDCFGKFFEKANKNCQECVERKHCLEVKIAKKGKAAKPAAAMAKPKTKPNGAAEAAESDTPTGQKPAQKFASLVVKMLIESKWKAFPKVTRELVDPNTFYFQINKKRRVLVSRAHSNEKFRVRLVNVKEKMAMLGADKTKWSKQENNRWLYIGEKTELPKVLRLIFKATSALAQPSAED